MEPSRDSRPVIRVELRGGLGNQLFQAATGYALARRLNGDLQFDVSSFRAGASRGYALEPFGHGATLVKEARGPARRLLRRLGKAFPGDILKRPSGWRGRMLTEQGYAYDPRIETVSGDCFLRGYFQSWRYFADHDAAVRAAFDPEAAASARARAFAAESGDYLAVHVRAGDFLQDAKINAVHGVLPADYYLAALELARSERPAPRTLVFSDNVEAARRLLAAETHSALTFVEGFSAVDDLYLMSRGRGHVIANSTFSYWSAWLDGSPTPFVVAPKAWLSPEALKTTDISDLYPSRWTLL